MSDAPTIPTLPDDLATCHKMIGELLVTVREQQRQLQEVQSRLDQLLRRIFGPRSERINPDQPLLFDDPAAAVPTPEPAVAKVLEPASKTGRHRRRKLPLDLPRVRIEHDLSAAEKAYPGCGDMRLRFGEDIRERLDYRPASFFAEHIRPKYACRKCESHLIAAPFPSEALPKCLAGAGLLAHVIVSKYHDHLPLHRLEGILERHGVPLSRSTLGDWMTGCAAALAPPYLLMAERVHQPITI